MGYFKGLCPLITLDGAALEIYIVRHGLSEANEKKILQGGIDFPLSDEGRRQAHHVGMYFSERGIHFDKVVTSILSRARETAEIILSYQENSPSLEEEEQFKEIDTGDLQGLTMDEVRDKYPSYYMRSYMGWLDFSEFGGENWEELYARVDKAMQKYILPEEQMGDGRLLLVVHGGVIRAMLRSLSGVSVNFMFLRVANCSQMKINHIMAQGQVRRYIEYFLPLSETLVGGKPFVHGISEEERDKLVS